MSLKPWQGRDGEADLSLRYRDEVAGYPSSGNAINQTEFSNEGRGNLLATNGREQ